MAHKSLKEKFFNKEIEAIRSIIQSAAKPFPSDKKAQKERTARAKTDLEYFGRTYFPHYIRSGSSDLHRYICKRFPEMVFRSIETGIGDKEADAAPRGNAKSTWTTLIFILWVAAYKYRQFPLIVSETSTQAEDFISFIKAELETNERLAQDFPDLCGEGPIWRADTVVTRNGIKMRGVGAGQKLRGMRHGSHRPDLVVGDDLENDEAVQSPDQRKKLEGWFFKALMKIGQKNTVYIVIGTILHYASLLSNLLKKPGWKGRKFKSVLKWSASPLWEKWETIFADITVSKEDAEAAADSFFTANRTAMLEGTEVLWPEVEDYYYLMKMRLTDGAAHFDSEKQNDPINPEDCLFKEESIQYWDDEDVDLAGVPRAGVVDPSMGKKAKRHDPSAILAGRYKGGRIYVEVADIEKRHPDRIISDILAYHEKDRFDKFGVESVAFQEFFKDTLEKEAHKKGLTLNVAEIKTVSDKFLRIQTLQPWIKNGWIVFKRSHRTLIDQLIHYPMGDHDDGPDGLEMLKSLIESGMVQAASASSEAQPEDYHAERKGGLMGRIFRRRRAHA